MQLDRLLHAVDAHAEGESTRVVIGGLPPVAGATMAEKRRTLMADDGLRRLLLFEPRGHVCLHAVCVFEPSTPEADAGVVIMEPTDYPAMSGSNTICAITVLLETGIVDIQEPLTRLMLETPGGLVAVEAECAAGRCERVRFENLPAFVVALDADVEVPGYGAVQVDVAWGGAFFAFVDAAEVGLNLVPEEAAELAALGGRITRAAAEQVEAVHPERPEFRHITFTTFTGAPLVGGDGRNATVVSPGRLDRSPCGTATSARLAVLAARGEVAEGADFVHEGILSTTFTGRIERRTTVGELDAMVTSISGRAWITGVHQVGRDPADPLGAGFTLPDAWLGGRHGVPAAARG